MATIKDVAKLAGVSTTTVSHVINKTRFVAEETRTRVWAAVKELHYSPSAVARSLKVNHTKSIGMIVTTSDTPYFAEIVQSVEEHCYRKGYTLFLCNSQNNLEKQRAYLAMLAQKRVDGLLVMCSEYNAQLLELLENYSTIPMVVMDWGLTDSNYTDRIQDNSFDGGYLATRYLIDRGHRDIGVITGQLSKTTTQTRYDGFIKAMQESGLPINDQWIAEGNFEPESGHMAMNTILSHKQHPTAVFCFNDTMAMGAICAAGEQNLRIPHDISIVGYDNIRDARFFSPPLTTIHQPKARLGAMAFDMLIDRIINKREGGQIIELHPELVARNSVIDGPYKQGK
ncbi:MAG: HTH-type transcriptional repressor PurR [Plesiomonas sp.]|uniref:HTH-type transcriptional repressor PurR n=1 Tax=Plesiomonas sp. TaxID=2486279 RepID=UPI003F35FEEF